MAETAPMDKLPDSIITAIRENVLNWYDRHRRVLPWRAKQGEQPIPYHVWLSEIMLQQTVVNAVIPYFIKFVDKWPALEDLAGAPLDDILHEWAGLGYYSRARNLHKCAQAIVSEYGGHFPDNPKELHKLPGIGDYTAAAITAIAFDKPATVVDGNIERVTARLFAITEQMPSAKKSIKAHVHLLCDGRTERPGDFAQALMDLGAAICIPKTPRCVLCPLSGLCKAREQGIAADLPHRAAKKQKPQRTGYIYWVENENGEILIERRTGESLLGGMMALPTSDWIEEGTPPARHLDFGIDESFFHSDLPSIRHSFTHFDLKLQGCRITLRINDYKIKEGQRWVKRDELNRIGMPTLFKKFIKLVI